MEKLQFSVEDLGRLAYEMQMKNASMAYQVIFEWLCGYEDNNAHHKAIWDALWRGYSDARSDDR